MHPLDDVLDGEEHVALKLGVGAMSLGISEHQRKLRHQILEVVDDKCRHSVELLKLACFQECLGGVYLTEIARRLPAGGLEHIPDLPVDVDCRPWRVEHNKPEQIRAGYERDDKPGIWNGAQPGGQRQIGITFPRQSKFLHIDHPPRALEEPGKRAIERLNGVDLWQVPPRRGHETASILLEPQNARGTLDKIGNRHDRPLVNALERALGRKRARKTEPFLAIVVAIGEKMLADEYPQLGAKA